MKRVIISSIIVLFIIGLIGAVYYYFSFLKFKGEHALRAVPANSAFIITYTPDKLSLKQTLASTFYQSLAAAPVFRELQHSLLRFDSLVQKDNALQELLKENPLIISAHITRVDEFDFLFLVSTQSRGSKEELLRSLQILAGLNADESIARNYDGTGVYESKLSSGNNLTWAYSNGVFMASCTTFLVEDALRQQKLKVFSSATDVFNESNLQFTTGNSIRIYFSMRNFLRLLSVFADPGKQNNLEPVNHFASWIAATPLPDKDNIVFKGFATANDSSELLNSFAGQEPVQQNIVSVFPAKTAAFISYSFTDKNLFMRKHEKHLLMNDSYAVHRALLTNLGRIYKVAIKDFFTSWLGSEFAVVITEPPGSDYNNSMFGVFKTDDTLMAKKKLYEFAKIIAEQNGTQVKQEKYSGHVISQLGLAEPVLAAVYGNSFSRITKNYYTIIDQNVVFANQASALRSFIDDYLDKNTLANSELFSALQSHTGKASNFFLYTSFSASRYIASSVISEKWRMNLEKNPSVLNKINAFAVNFSMNDSKAETMIVFQSRKKSSPEARLVRSLQLDTLAAIAPQSVMPAAGKPRMIFVQDVNNMLYAFDNGGSEAWKTQLDERIMSRIYTADVFRNGQYHFLFNTAGKLYLINSRGMNVSNFPLLLPAPATNGIAVADLYSTRDYRIYVACANGKVVAYQGNGLPVVNWNYDLKTGTILKPLEIFGEGDSTVLTLSNENGRLFFIDRFGAEAFTIESDFRMAPNSRIESITRGKVSYYVTTSAEGKITAINNDGEASELFQTEVSSLHTFAAADLNNDEQTDFFILDPDKLSVFDIDRQLLFYQELGEPAEPYLGIVKLSDGSVKTGVYSSAGKTFLFNSDGTLYKGFPVRGAFPFTVDELNADGRLYMVTAGNDGVVYVYSLE